MVLTFQNPILVLVLALKTSIFLSVASFWLPPLSYIRVSSDDSRSPSHPVASISSVAVSVTGVFLRNRIVSPVSSPNLEDQWIALRQASTVRPVSRQHSSRDHWDTDRDKVAILQLHHSLNTLPSPLTLNTDKIMFFPLISSKPRKNWI